MRVDTGVYDGGEISMFYDSMIAKLIVHGATREQAIARMRDALNGFVIRGISSNIPFQAALMQHRSSIPASSTPASSPSTTRPASTPRWCRTTIRPCWFPVAAYVYRAFTDRSASISGQLQGHERIVGDQWMVVRLNKEGNEHHPVVTRRSRAATTSSTRAEYEILSDWKLGSPCSTAPATASPFTLQVERHKTKYSLFHWGTRADFMVMSARAAELLALMPEKLPPDLSKFLLSPMPGLLREVSVRSVRK